MTTVTTEQEKILSRGSDLAFLSQPTAQSAGISFALNDDSNSTVSEALAIAEIPSNSPEVGQSRTPINATMMLNASSRVIKVKK